MRLAHFPKSSAPLPITSETKNFFACQYGSPQVIIADDGGKTMPMAQSRSTLLYLQIASKVLQMLPLAPHRSRAYAVQDIWAAIHPD
jgi:hypothetical protein